jgi:hypothetical protein
MKPLRTLPRRGGVWLVQQVRAWRHRHFGDIVFIHINKTGGSSIEEALKLPFEHKTALEKIAQLGRDEWDRRYTFAAVRNPWDKVVSHYHYRIQTDQTHLAEATIPFREWVVRSYGRQDPAYYDHPRMFMPQSDWVADADGRVLVDFICHFETLAEDFAHVCGHLGIDAALPHLKASRHRHYREYYDDETAAVIATWFDADLRNFGYEF